MQTPSHREACAYFADVVSAAIRCVHTPLTRSEAYAPPPATTLFSISARSSCEWPVTQTLSPAKGGGRYPRGTSRPSSGRNSPSAALSRSHAGVAVGTPRARASRYFGELTVFATQKSNGSSFEKLRFTVAPSRSASATISF